VLVEVEGCEVVGGWPGCAVFGGVDGLGGGRRYRGFWAEIRHHSQFLLVKGVLSGLKHDGHTAICVTKEGRGLRKCILPPDLGPILSAPRRAAGSSPNPSMT